MSKLSNKLLIAALYSAFAVASTGSAVAENRQQHSGPSGGVATLKSCVITVTNRGSGALKITDAPTVDKTSGPGNFSIITPSTGTPCIASLVVAPYGTCTIGVQYTSSSREMSTARVRLTDSGAETSTHETEIAAN